VNAHLLPLVGKLPPDGPLEDEDGAGGAADEDWTFFSGAAGDEAGGADVPAGVVVGLVPVAVTVMTFVLRSVVVVVYSKGQTKISSVTVAVTVVATRVYVPGVKVIGTGKTW
jgi:hypothetical protein